MQRAGGRGGAWWGQRGSLVFDKTYQVCNYVNYYLDFFVSARFLGSKLVARKCQNDEVITQSQDLKHSLKLGVVVVCEAAL